MPRPRARPRDALAVILRHAAQPAARGRRRRRGDTVAWTRRSPATTSSSPPGTSGGGGEGRVWSGRPNAVLVTEATGLAPGRALDLGCGEGDAIWLAEQGWQVWRSTSPRRAWPGRGARRRARRGRPGRVAARRPADLDPGDERFDLVTSCFLHLLDHGCSTPPGRWLRAVAPAARCWRPATTPTTSTPAALVAARRHADRGGSSRRSTRSSSRSAPRRGSGPSAGTTTTGTDTGGPHRHRRRAGCGGLATASRRTVAP